MEPWNRVLHLRDACSSARRVGSRLRRVYDTPQTPLDRLRATKDFNREEVKRRLRMRATTDPFALARTIERKLERIATLARRRDGATRVTSQTA